MASSVENYVHRAEAAEQEIEKLLAELKTLEKSSTEKSDVPEELEKLETENRKLKYRLGILKEATAQVKKGSRQ